MTRLKYELGQSTKTFRMTHNTYVISSFDLPVRLKTDSAESFFIRLQNGLESAKKTLNLEAQPRLAFMRKDKKFVDARLILPPRTGLEVFMGKFIFSALRVDYETNFLGVSNFNSNETTSTYKCKLFNPSSKTEAIKLRIYTLDDESLEYFAFGCGAMSFGDWNTILVKEFDEDSNRIFHVDVYRTLDSFTLKRSTDEFSSLRELYFLNCLRNRLWEN